MNYNYSDLNFINRELDVVWPGWSAVRLLGKGSFGAVYEIHRNIRGILEKAAMKVLRVPDSDTEIARIQFQGMSHQSTEDYYENLVDGIYNEIRIMQQFVGNSHIVSYEDYAIRKRDSEIGWDIYIRMELLTGLTYYMTKYPMNDQMVIKLGMDISQGLNDCHSSGIIHRDIKPENIFVNERGDFKLGDFGVSRNTPGSQDVLSFKGTLGYMAPEVYRMISTDARSDIYSLGMVLYQCLNDYRLPFMPENFTPYDIETARQRRFSGEPIPAPTHGSKRLKDLVLKAVAYRPEDRFQTAEEMYRALQSVNGTDHAGSGANYQKPDNRAVRQKSSSVNHNDVSTETIKTNKAPQGQSHPNRNTQEQSFPKQNTQHQPDVKKSTPKKSIPKTSAKVPTGLVAMATVLIAAIVILYLYRPDIFNPGQGYSNYTIDWKDAALEAKMRKITGIASGDIMYSDVKDLTVLKLSNGYDADDNVKIKDISALSNLTNLTSLYLDSNQISDISPLSEMNSLNYLDLCQNQISDISPLSGLTKLRLLHLDSNQISDISPLSSLINLDHLYLQNNQISDISSLSEMNSLNDLDLDHNQISDISPLSSLTKLINLYLDSNQISDISPLSSLAILINLDLNSNQISDISPLSSLTTLTSLDLSSNQISDISPLSGLTKLHVLFLDNNPISNYSPIEDLDIEYLSK